MNPAALHLVADQADRAHARVQRTHSLARAHHLAALCMLPGRMTLDGQPVSLLLPETNRTHLEAARVLVLNLQALEHETNELRRLLREQATG